ncbi:uncharacterized protein [Amphiura filiformis]|uniref:uncharacterized protein n=1 Tax=Amphiura filiformis TaxID=82378 RepID=UPI003B21BC91
MENDHVEISTFENGRYTDDIRVTVYELLSMGVGSKKVSEIIRTVLERVAKMKVTRLPKPTIIKYMATEQGMLAKRAAQHAIETSSDPITLHTDGTSKHHNHYLTYLASTSSGTVAMGLHDIHSETADEMVKQAEEALVRLTDLLPNTNSENEKKVQEMLCKIKNTMTDRAVVNKAFVRKFGEWRANVLPNVFPQWEELSENVRVELVTINDLYCGKHLVLNLQEYAASALNEWEKVESGGGKLGRERHILWNRGNESASLLAVRSFCTAFGPDADPAAGYDFEFIVHLEDKFEERSHLQEYRGNRFNIPFENSTAVYFHIPHIPFENSTAVYFHSIHIRKVYETD